MRNKRRRPYRVSATTAAKTFGGIVNRVREDAATYVVERGGVPVAEIRPVTGSGATIADLIELLGAYHGQAGDEFGSAVSDGVRQMNRRQIPRDPWAS